MWSVLAGRTTQTIAGIDYYNSDYDSDRSLNKSTRNQPIHQLSIDQTSMAAYADTSITLTDSLYLNLGGRIQRVEQEGRDDFDPTAPGAMDKFESGAADFDQDDTEYMLEAGIERQFTPAMAAYLKGSRSARFATVDELFEIMRSLKEQGKTIILTSHYLEEIQTLCNDIAIINHGKIVAEGTKADFIKDGKSVEETYLEITRKNKQENV
mgnify:CR=1 FL=1